MAGRERQSPAAPPASGSDAGGDSSAPILDSEPQSSPEHSLDPGLESRAGPEEAEKAHMKARPPQLQLCRGTDTRTALIPKITSKCQQHLFLASECYNKQNKSLMMAEERL